MAEQLDSFTFPTHGRPYKYEWKAWANGKPWRLVSGKDFDVSCETMRTNARTYAAKHSLKVRTAVTDEGTTLVIQFFPAEK